MKRKNTIPTILGVLVLLLGSLAGVFLLNSAQVFKIGADVTSAAKNIRVANVSDTSVTISWTTDKETTGYLIWGAREDNINKIENEDIGGQKFLNHIINLTGLSPGTKYYYKINSDGTTFDNSGIPWQVTTGPSLAVNKNSSLISGNVVSATGIPAKRALVYAEIAGYLMATTTSNTGNFVIQIGSARTNDLQRFAEIDPTQTLVQLSVQAGDGVSSAQIYPQSGNPAPAIIIGQTYDFRNIPANNLGSNPNASLNLPTDNLQQQSKFSVASTSQPQKSTTIILESLSQGEVITTQKPQFFGKGPEGTTLTITVHSETQINESIQIPKNGSWSYAVPSNLEPGQHTITISWVDVSGITRFLTRDFVVSAGEVPAFTASNSASTPSPSPTSIININEPTGTPAPSAKPTLTPTPLPSASAIPVPVTGDLTPTFLLFMMGLVIMTFSFIVWKFAKN